MTSAPLSTSPAGHTGRTSWIAELDRRQDFRTITGVLLPLMALVLFPASWYPNEEFTYILAHRSVVPDAFSPFSAVFDQHDARFVFKAFAGGLVTTIGYEATQIFIRLLMAALYAVSFGYLFSILGVSALRALATIVLFDLAGETIFGDDWFFRGAESKTFAYAAVLFGLGLGLRSRWILATLLMVVATYVHFLVGGFWMFALLVLALLRKATVGHLVRLGSVYVLLVAPLAIVIAVAQFGDPSIVADGGVDPDQLYAMRNAHHIAPFSGGWVTWTWFRGLVGAIALFCLMVLVAKSAPDRSLPLFALVLLGYFFVASGLAFIDRDTHILAKFYLFRPTTLTLFFTIAVALGLADHWMRESWKLRLVPVLTGVIILGFVVQGTLKVKDFIVFLPFAEQAELIAVIEEESAPDEIVLIEPVLEKVQPYVALSRVIPRPTFVSFKFVPTNPKEILIWQDRLNYRSEIFENGCQARLIYPIRLLLVFKMETLDRLGTCGPVVWRGVDMALVRLNDDLLANRQTAKVD